MTDLTIESVEASLKGAKKSCVMATISPIPGAHPEHRKLTQDLRASEIDTLRMTFELDPVWITIPSGTLVKALRAMSPDLPIGLAIVTVMSGDLNGRSFAVEEKMFLTA